MKGDKVALVLFFIGGFVAFVAAVFMYVQNEKSPAKAAEAKAALALGKIENIDKSDTAFRQQLNEEFKRQVDANKALLDLMLSKDSEADKIKQRVDWLALRAENQMKHPGTQKIELVQSRPIEISITYRKAKDIKPMTDAAVHSEVIKRVQQQVKDLSQ